MSSLLRQIYRGVNAALAHTAVATGVNRWLRPATEKLWRVKERTFAWPDVRFFIDHLPTTVDGGVGGNSDTGWLYQQGYFFALIRNYLPEPSIRMLDFGCGSGKLAPVGMLLSHPDGQYVGVEITASCIDVCRETHADLPRTTFHLARDYNASYPESHGGKVGGYGADWPVADGSRDLVIAVSVFTHLQKREAEGYIRRIREVLRPGGVAILTFHLLDEPRREPIFGTDPGMKSFTFEHALPEQSGYFTSFLDAPEGSIALTHAALAALVAEGFSTERVLRGTRFGGTDGFFQDVVVLRKQ